MILFVPAQLIAQPGNFPLLLFEPLELEIAVLNKDGKFYLERLFSAVSIVEGQVKDLDDNAKQYFAEEFIKLSDKAEGINTAQHEEAGFEAMAMPEETRFRDAETDMSLKEARLETGKYQRMLAERSHELDNAVSQAKELEVKLRAEIARGNLRVRRMHKKIVLSVDEKIVFAPGSATVRLEFLKTLDKIAVVLGRNRKSQVVIEGHTDNSPIHQSGYIDNWQLSTERATEVLRMVLRHKNLNAARFSARGFGEFHPLVPNSTARNRQKNRRVDLVILPEN